MITWSVYYWQVAYAEIHDNETKEEAVAVLLRRAVAQQRTTPPSRPLQPAPHRRHGRRSIMSDRRTPVHNAELRATAS